MDAPILITGATSGIGRDLVGLLSSQGRPCIATGRSCVSAVDGTTTWVGADLTTVEGRGAVVHAASDVRAVVHVAGMCVRGALESLSEADVHEILDVDLIAPILLTRSLLPSLRANRGVVVGVSSLAGRIGSPGNALYSAAKFGLDGWLEAMSYELAHVGVSSRVVIPLYVSTAFMEKSADREPATSGPYTSFEQATRARLSGSLETAASPREVAGQLLGVVDEALSGGVGFDRVVLGDPAVLSEHFTRGAADWFEYFQSQVEPWYSSSEPISFCESDRVD